MTDYIVKRIIMLVPVVLMVQFFVFTILYLSPGDPTVAILGENVHPDDRNTLREEMGLNDPFIEQLGRYIGGVFRGDFGSSYVSQTPVLPDLLQRFPVTLLLASLSMCIMVIIGLPIGIISAVKQYSLGDTALTTLTMILVSMPTFWTGLLLIMLFSLTLGWLPPSGWFGPTNWIMPSLAIGLSNMGYMGRTTRSSMLEVIRQDYVRTARAKGMKELNIIFKHILRNSLIPILTVFGNQLGVNLAGSMITEQVFSIPGIGTYMFTAINRRDYPVVLGCVLFIAIIFTLLNLIIDIIYAFIDPRIKEQYKMKSIHIFKLKKHSNMKLETLNI